MLKSLFVFKEFVIQFVKSLTLDERFWCQGIIPESKLDANLSKDGEMLRLIVFLCNDAKLSFNDLSLLRKFLLSVNRCDILEKLERVELRITVGSILEAYIKSVNGFRQMASRYKNIVEFLATTREGNQEVLSREVNDDNKILENLDSAILDLQLSWSMVISSLLIMGELFVSFSPGNLAENGYYVSMFSETRASECLTVWMLENGGLVSNTHHQTP